MSDMDDRHGDEVLQSATREASREMARQLEYELLGAWRAGYDYVHHYIDMTYVSGGDAFEFRMRFRQYVLPSNTTERPSPDGKRYVDTYVLKGVDPEEIREAMQ